jgi:hypothetical protein
LIPGSAEPPLSKNSIGTEARKVAKFKSQQVVQFFRDPPAEVRFVHRSDISIYRLMRRKAVHQKRLEIGHKEGDR